MHHCHQKNLYSLIGRCVLRTFLHGHFVSVPIITFGVQLKARAKKKSQHAKNRQVKNKSRGRNPVMGKIPILNFFQFFIVLMLKCRLLIHSTILCCKNNGCFSKFEHIRAYLPPFFFTISENRVFFFTKCCHTIECR